MNLREPAKGVFWGAMHRVPLARRRKILYRLRHGVWPDLDNPTKFSEKMQWRILFDRRPLIGDLGDKQRMKDRAAEWSDVRIPRTAWFGTDLRELEAASDLPKRWVLKPNHTSNRVVFGEGRPDVDSLIAQTQGWVDAENPLWKYQGEWIYSQARPALILEERLGGDVPPPDFKIFVFDGEVAEIQVDDGRFGEPRRRLYLPDWTPLNVRHTHELAPVEPAPANLDRMLEVAEKLGRGFDFIRVDLYDVDGDVWFGELSPCAGGGLTPFDPVSHDEHLGRLWTLPV